MSKLLRISRLNGCIPVKQASSGLPESPLGLQTSLRLPIIHSKDVNVGVIIIIMIIILHLILSACHVTRGNFKYRKQAKKIMLMKIK